MISCRAFVPRVRAYASLLACFDQPFFDCAARCGQAFVHAFCMLLASFWQASGRPSASNCPAISEHLCHTVSAFAQPFAGTGRAFAQQVEHLLPAFWHAVSAHFVCIWQAWSSILRACGMLWAGFFCVLFACPRQAFCTLLANTCLFAPFCASFSRGRRKAKKLVHFSICACHPCAGAMLIFSVSFQF